MKKVKKIATKWNPAKLVSVAVMFFCLALLTGANFIVYPQTQTPVSAALASNSETNDEESPAPVEEKSSSKIGLTVQEEYIHDHHSMKDLSGFIVSSKHKIPEVEKLQIVHFELVSPPPKA